MKLFKFWPSGLGGDVISKSLKDYWRRMTVDRKRPITKDRLEPMAQVS